MAVVATNWSGPTEYLNGRMFWPLDYKLCEPGEDYISKAFLTDCVTDPAQDAIPDVDDLCEAMLHMYESRREAEEMGRLASAHVALDWTWDIAMDKFVD